MLLTIASLAILATPSLTAPALSSCFGPCHLPGCPNSTFYVCHETPGSTKVYSSNGGATWIATQPNDATNGVGVGGATIQPGSGETWGSAGGCGELVGDCN